MKICSLILYIFRKKNLKEHMELLLITNNDNNSHYVLIKNFNKFMYQQTKHKNKKHFCMHCLQCFSSIKILNKHKPNCITINGKQAIKMPEKGEQVYFKNYHKQLNAPFVI